MAMRFILATRGMAPLVKLRRSLLFTVAVGVVAAACQESEGAVAPGSQKITPGVGTESTLLGRGTFGQGFQVKRTTGDWQVEVTAQRPLDLAVQTIVFQPGGHSGWHRHPGPVFIQVTAGTMTFYESDDPRCAPITRTVGQGYLDTGEHAHIARNETGAPATNLVTYLAPTGAALRIDMPDPGNCRF